MYYEKHHEKHDQHAKNQKKNYLKHHMKHRENFHEKHHEEHVVDHRKNNEKQHVASLYTVSADHLIVCNLSIGHNYKRDYTGCSNLSHTLFQQRRRKT